MGGEVRDGVGVWGLGNLGSCDLDCFIGALYLRLQCDSWVVQSRIKPIVFRGCSHIFECVGVFAVE